CATATIFGLARPLASW
nr:immunoglobulin heavy chain junction region [Macaca mulatta]MOV38111.1 immunoglobulin heavy chain junction region [Macaca mulatta]MOV38300.1 immunoglobulin heavy chain junction region [Macaca mulatta]MOV39806.1 immunoglobulin heavy chain junction region [Macaca mulatta]MOV39978.1 immunoglobulin heavy chain junction region [Macaca mulatta]